MFRLDRFLTLYFFQPLLKLIGNRERHVPILMYHSISDDPEIGISPYFRVCTPLSLFKEQMSWLRENGYSVIDLADAIRSLRSDGHLPSGKVVLTFDDGFQNFYTDAFPVLSRYGFTATVFLPTAYIGETAQKFRGAECLTWKQVRELGNMGVHFGSHTVTHPQLRMVKIEELKTEVWQSKNTIEDKLSVPVKSFSYPFAFPETDRIFGQRLRAMLEDAGYECGVSTNIGTASREDNRFFMKRLPVNSCDDLQFFKAKLEGSYDWLHTFQYAYKLVARERTAAGMFPYGRLGR